MDSGASLLGDAVTIRIMDDEEWENGRRVLVPHDLNSFTAEEHLAEPRLHDSAGDVLSRPGKLRSSHLLAVRRRASVNGDAGDPSDPTG